MQNALDILKFVVEEAEAQARNTKLKIAISEAKGAYKEAQEDYDEAIQYLNIVQQECGNPDDRLQIASKEIEEYTERARKVQSFINQDRDIETIIKTARQDIEDQYHSAKEKVEKAKEQVEKKRVGLNKARDTYAALEEQSKGYDIGIISAQTLYDTVQSLIEEIDVGLPELDRWPREARHAQLCVWLGKARKMQDIGGLSGKEQDDLHHQVFGRLNAVNKELTGLFIDALDRDYVANWDDYITQHQVRHQTLCKEHQELADQEEEKKQLQEKDLQRRREARKKSETYMSELAARCGREESQQNSDEIVALTKVLLEDVSLEPSDPELVDLLFPIRDIFDNKGNTFRPLRRAFQTYEAEIASRELKKRSEDMIELVRNKKAIMIGGSPRENNRHSLLDFFEFAELKWESCQGNEPRIVDRIEQSIRTGGVDMVIELTSLVGHHVERLKPVCQESDIPFVRVARGYGVRALIGALRGHTNNIDQHSS